MSQSFSSRLIGALRNENVIALSYLSGLTSVKLADAKTGKVFAYCTEQESLAQGVFNKDYAVVNQDAGVLLFHSWDEYVSAIKALGDYPAPKVREPKMIAKTHGAPKYVGISMGSFKPENVTFA